MENFDFKNNPFPLISLNSDNLYYIHTRFTAAKHEIMC